MLMLTHVRISFKNGRDAVSRAVGAVPFLALIRIKKRVTMLPSFCRTPIA